MPKTVTSKQEKRQDSRYNPIKKTNKNISSFFNKKIICIYRLSAFDYKKPDDFVEKIKSQKNSVMEAIDVHYPQWKRDYIIEEKTEGRSISDIFRKNKKLGVSEFLESGVFGRYVRNYKNDPDFNYKNVIFCFYAPDRVCRSVNENIQNEILQYQLYFSSINYFYPSIFDATEDQTKFIRQKFAEGAAESKSISERLKARNAATKAAGKKVGPSKFGFNTVKGIVVPNATEQQIIKEIVDALNKEEMNELHRQGKNVYELMANKLNTEKKYRRGQEWTAKSIESVFENNDGEKVWKDKFKYVCTCCYHRFVLDDMFEESIKEVETLEEIVDELEIFRKEYNGICRFCKESKEPVEHDVVVSIDDMNLEEEDNDEEADLFN